MGRKNKAKAAIPTETVKQKAPAKELNELVDKLLRISTIPQHQNVQKALENQREIEGIIAKVQRLEMGKENRRNNASGSVDKQASGDTIGDFLNWALTNGAQLNGCTIQTFEGYGLGLKANQDIPESTLVISVPRKLMLSLEAAEASFKELIAKDKILSSMLNVTLAILLLVEKFKEESFWKPYINLLPTVYTTVLYFSTEELEELRGSPTLEIALRQIKSIARQYAYFHKLFNTSDDPVSRIMKDRFTFNEYRWAVSTVMTRQNTIPFQEDYHALIPLWDLCNHTNGTISTSFNPVLDRSECLALRDFKSGEQLFIFYGSRNNADLFIHNGFVYEDNVHDNYCIKLGISKSDPLQEKRTQLLAKLAIPPNADFYLQKSSNPIDGSLLAFLRVFNMNAEQLDHWLSSDKSGDLKYKECALDTELEKKSWGFLQARLKLLLATYKTSLDEDEKLIIVDNNLSANSALAIRMRATEKRILKETIEYVEQCINQ